MRVRFGDFVFDAERRLVSRGGEDLALSPKAFALLGALIEERPRAVSKAALHDRLWPRTFVSQTSLARVMTELRHALQDPRERACLLRTVHGYGYAFCGEVTEDRSASGLSCPCSLLLGKREVPLPIGVHLIGRGPECVLRLNSSEVSRVHARVVVGPTEACIEDLGSKNGTSVGGRRIAGSVVLKAGVEIVVGPAVLVFQVAPPGASTDTMGRGERSGSRPR